MGLPEDLTEEEKAAEAAAAAQKAEAASKKKASFVSVKPITGLASMRPTASLAPAPGLVTCILAAAKQTAFGNAKTVTAPLADRSKGHESPSLVVNSSSLSHERQTAVAAVHNHSAARHVETGPTCANLQSLEFARTSTSHRCSGH